MTYYRELGLSWSASHRAVCTAYRQRALQTHPDKGGSHDAYVRVRQAFEVLSDQRLRADYDAGLRAAGEEDAERLAPSWTSTTASATGSECRSSEPLVLMGDTPWREAARTVVGMMDLPESAWAATLESWNVAGSSCTDRGRRRTFTATLPKSLPQCLLKVLLFEASTGPSKACPSDESNVQFSMYATLKKRTIGTSPSPATYDEFRQVPASGDSHLKVELRRKAGLVAAAAFLPSLPLLPVLQVDEKTSSAPSEREAFRVTWLPDPDELFQVVPWNSGEALDETYDADPELRLVLQFRVSIREAKKVLNGPFTHRLETALHLRNRLQQLLEMRGSSHDIGKEIRDAKTYEKKQKGLEKARQAAMLQEVLVVLEQLRREEGNKPVPLALPALPAPEPLELPAPAATQAAELTAQQGKEAEPEDSVDAVRATGSLGSQIPESQAEAAEVDGCVADCLLGERVSFLAALVTVSKVQNAIREAHDPRAQERHCSERRADRDVTWMLGLKEAANLLERQLPGINMSLCPRDGQCRLEKHEGAFYPGLLTICELVRVTTTSRRAYGASAGATKRQLANFRLADFGRTTARSKRGRVLPGGEHRELRMLQECLRTRRFALQIQHLDLSTLEMSSISKQDFQYMLGCLPNLVSVIFPSRGWAGTLQLRTFVNIAKSLKVSIGALKGDLMILRGAAQRSTDEARPTPLAITAGEATPPSRKRPRVEVAGAPPPRPRRSTRREAQADSDALGFRAAVEDVRRSSEARILPATSYSAPVNGQTLAPRPETHRSPDLQPAVQALRSGGLRRRKEITENQRDSRDRHAGSHSFWWPERR
ncbi:DNAJ1 [Symbiodinium necroappetens]|uniref:DNAJ1 protein n=1 Tax=Symbiodinium necroappetens TaxID=1628268 RepID=A0A812Q5M2_9DINO|nr:DNAJ1 [Symbiodinium necroappetens]